MIADYEQFLQSKLFRIKDSGIQARNLSPVLFPFQADLVRWALRKGRAAIFADTGLGKTLMQAEWAREINEQTGERVLIVAPLSVARQTVRIAAGVLGTEIGYSRDGDTLYPLTITNYEMVHHFNAADFGAVVLDESSILKALDGKTRRLLTTMFAETPYRLACTATPAPNDIAEIGNHAEFLGIMSAAEMKATFFVNTGDTADKWSLKGHGEQHFYRWLASWGMSVRKPSDLGYEDDGYILPPLHIEPVFLDTGYVPEGQLFNLGLSGIQHRSEVRRETMEERTQEAARLVNDNEEQWIVWCGLNDESAEMARLLGNQAVEVTGSDSPEHKAEALEAFQDGSYRVLITKPKIAGFGMNFQNCHNQVFVGMNDSWEMYYQCIRRSYRFGQDRPVNIYLVLAEAQRPIYENVMAKEAQAAEMSERLIEHVRQYEQEELEGNNMGADFVYEETTVQGHNWTAMLGDSVERLAELDDDSIHLSVFSPPFEDLFTYTATERDLGNSKSSQEFFAHFAYIIQHLYRVTVPGRNCAVHVADIPAMKVRDGYMGMKDFPGEVIRAFEREGWIWYGRTFIEKNPQSQAIRTKAHALMFKQLRKDSAASRPAIADQILVFKKPGDNPEPITPVQNGEMDNDTWIRWANPIWLIDSETDEEVEIGLYGHWHGIHESDTLQYRDAREEEDTKHICPLQLGTIERCIKLWSNPGETVLSPFGGIGSEGYEAVKHGRRAVIIELKRAYFEQAVKNLRRAEREKAVPTLFDYMATLAPSSNGNGHQEAG
jgi:DNA modification methylase/superfamily II DNA or RNA helicase